MLANPAPAEPAAKANFIAAARRAAQAAAAESTHPAGAAEERSQTAGGLAAAVASRRRPFMVAAGVLLFGAGSVHLALNGHLLPFVSLKDSVRTEAPGSPLEEILSPAVNAKPAAVPDSSEPRAAPAPDPIVPEMDAAAARRPARSTSEDSLLSPVPEKVAKGEEAFYIVGAIAGG